MDDPLLGPQSVDDPSQPPAAMAQVRKHRLVFDGVVHGHHPAVGLAVGAEGPVVLPHGHLVDGRAGRAGVQSARRHLVDQVVDLVQFAAQVIVDVDQVLAFGLLARSVGAVGFTGRAPGTVGLVPDLGGAAAGPVVGGGHDREGVL